MILEAMSCWSTISEATDPHLQFEKRLLILINCASHMKPYPTIILVSVLTTGIRIAAQSHQHARDSVSAIFSKFKQTRHDKSIVLLTNRNIYLAGENIWFKAYVVNPDGKLDLTFNNLFADLVNENDKVIAQVVLDNKAMQTRGAFKLTESLLISSFRTNDFGLARLTFVNDPGEKYTAIFYVNGNVVRYELPAANESSIQLSLGNQTAKSVKAFVTLEYSVPANTHTTLLAVRRDSLYYAAVGTGSYGITIPIDNFPGGITRLLLFDGNNSLVSERDFYIPKENVGIEVKPDKKKSSNRENITLHLKITGTNGVPLASVVNIAVEDQGNSTIVRHCSSKCGSAR